MKKLFPQKLKNIYHLCNAILANIRYGFPSKKLKAVGITGTDGKTTTSYFLHNILITAGYKAGLVSTIMAKFGDNEVDVGLHVTSPNPWDLQKLLREMVDAGMEYVVLEVTSHAIDQHRFWGVHFAAAGLTNITPEHLDYHKTFEAYQAVKLGFLARAQKSFKSEDIEVEYLADVQVKLPGNYNRQNARLAGKIAEYLGVGKEHMKRGIEQIEALPGRMEVIADDDVKVVVDFAHTPNGLEQALRSMRKEVNDRGGKLIVVFGSAGERDFEKRPVMGKVAGQLADFVVITAEDPRSERVEDISQSIAAGSVEAGKKKDSNLFIVLDRRQAIEHAIKVLAKPKDLVIITGKGHEQSMNFGGVEQPWDDRQVVREVMEL